MGCRLRRSITRSPSLIAGCGSGAYLVGMGRRAEAVRAEAVPLDSAVVVVNSDVTPEAFDAWLDHLQQGGRLRMEVTAAETLGEARAAGEVCDADRHRRLSRRRAGRRYRTRPSVASPVARGRCAVGLPTRSTSRSARCYGDGTSTASSPLEEIVEALRQLAAWPLLVA